jgi:hypothetical protein
MSNQKGWAPVVYGRNPRADVWWQVRPPFAAPAWLNETVVGCTVAHGRGLRESPRLLLAQRSGLRLVGVACTARLLSGTMYSDGDRDLHCFVGWLTSDLSSGPDWETFSSTYQRSAADVYERHMSQVWDKPYWDLGEPDPGSAGPAPWPASADVGRPPGLPGRGPVEPDRWADVWNGALATSRPLTVVLGWASRQAVGTGTRADYVGIGPLPAAPIAPTVAPAPQPQPLLPPPTTKAVSLPQPTAGDSVTIAGSDTGTEPDTYTGSDAGTEPNTGKNPDSAGTGGAVGVTRGLRVAAGASVLCLLLGLLAGYLIWGRSGSRAVGSTQPLAVGTRSPTPSTPPTPTPTPTPSTPPIALRATLRQGGSLAGLEFTSTGTLTSADGTTGAELPRGQAASWENCRKVLAFRSSGLPAVRPQPGLTVCVGARGSSLVLIATVTGVQNPTKVRVVSVTVGFTAANGS